MSRHLKFTPANYDPDKSKGCRTLRTIIQRATSRAVDRSHLRNRVGSANIIIVGAGGAGNNTIDRLMRVDVKGAKCVAVNTDQQHLDFTNAHQKILIGRTLTRGLGAGGMPEVGRDAAEESRDELDEALRGADLVFVTCGEGGGTGTGSAPVIAEIAKLNGALVVGVVTTPFSVEKGRTLKAQLGLKELQKFADTLIVIENDKLLEIVPDLPIEEAFSVADEVLSTMVKGITETISLPSLINLDYADVRSILSTGGVAVVGIGESDSRVDRVGEAIRDALDSPLLHFDINGARGALIHVTGGHDMTLQEASDVANRITQHMHPESTVIWGARVDPEMNGYLRVMMLITGITSPQVFGPSSELEDNHHAENRSDATRVRLSDPAFNLTGTG
ncbi:MAG: cell division protein FtsZ [Promethearchaeota archaeon]